VLHSWCLQLANLLQLAAHPENRSVVVAAEVDRIDWNGQLSGMPPQLQQRTNFVSWCLRPFICSRSVARSIVQHPTPFALDNKDNRKMACITACLKNVHAFCLPTARMYARLHDRVDSDPQALRQR
jgi:hypothetical protein